MLTFNRLRNLSLLAAFAAAPIPLFIYITAEHTNWLWLMIGVNIFAYLMVALTTIRITLDVAQREKQKSYVPAKWANNPVMSRWYTAVRLSRKWHVLAAIARMGLVLGVVEFFYSENLSYRWRYSPIIKHVFGAILYGRSHQPDFNYSQNGLPQIQTFIIGTVFIGMFALAEVGLLSAIVLCFNTSGRRIGKPVFVKAILLGMVFVIFAVSLVPASYYRERRQCFGNCTTRWGEAAYHREILAYIETAQIFLYALADQGTLLTVNIMRPIIDCPDLDTRRFVARNIVAGLLGLLLYAGLTRGLLWLARKQAKTSAFDADAKPASP